MTLKVAIQMDHISLIDIDVDSTFVIAMEAQKRGFDIFHYQPANLIMKDERLFAWGEPLKIKKDKASYFQLGSGELLDLSEMDVVLMRQDPPFDMSYITATHLLDHLASKTLVVNNPTAVRNAPEKLFVTEFSAFTPPTLITSNHDQVRLFRNQYKDIVLKPLFGNGGFGVVHITPEDENLNAVLELFSQHIPEPIVVQKYLPAVRQGDKRIILIDGKAAGAVNRIPPKGEARSNLHVGGKAKKATLTDREQQICEQLGPELSQRGLIFAGIDMIGDYLTEINVTSPTGLQEINHFDNSCLEADIWNTIEQRIENFL